MKKIRHIYYLCPDDNTPSGGIHKIYDHVEILNSSGYSAYVLHHNFGFQCSWFNHNVTIAYPLLDLKQICINLLKRQKNNYILNWHKGLQLQTQTKALLPPISEEDVLVIPEYQAHKYNFLHNGLPFIIFNQNAYYSFNSLEMSNFETHKPKSTIYHSGNLLGIMTVSEDNTNYLKHVYPHLKMLRIRNAINPSKFSFSEEKKPWIAFMPRKQANDIKQVLFILQERNKLSHWKFQAIDNATESEIAHILKKSAIFLSFVYQEGFSLPSVEAMACGCITIGNHGQGGKEYLNPFYTIESGNIIVFADKVEKIALDYDQNPEKYKNACRESSRFILDNYSLEHEKEDVRHAWNEFQVILNHRQL